MAYDYMATILGMVFWDGRLIGYTFLVEVENVVTQW
jgi:hypothetical protein